MASRALGRRRALDLMHYASATVLECTHLASWDKEHFNSRVQSRINMVNDRRGLAALIVGDPVVIVRKIEIG